METVNSEIMDMATVEAKADNTDLLDSIKCVYCIVPVRAHLIKIGRWKGSYSKLYSHYVPLYGRFEIHVFQVENEVESEKELFQLLESYRWSRELFEKETIVVEKFFEWCEKNAFNHVILPSVYEKLRIRKRRQNESAIGKADARTLKMVQNVVTDIFDQSWGMICEKKHKAET